MPTSSARASTPFNTVGVVTAMVGMQVIWALIYFFAPSPWMALAGIAAAPIAIGICIYPQLGVLLLSLLLIGQWPNNAVTYLGLITICSAIAWLLLNGRPLIIGDWLLFLTIGFLALGVISLIQPQTSIDTVPSLLSLAGRCSIVWMFATLITRRDLLLNCFRLMIASGIATALIGLVQWRTHFTWITSTTHDVLAKAKFRDKSVMDLQGWQGQFRIDSITGTPDYLPLYMQSLIPFVAYWILRQQTLSRRLAGLFVLSIFAAAHVLSFTRGALLTTIAVVLLLVWQIDRKRLIAYGPAVAAILLIGMLSWTPTRERLLSMVEINREEAKGNVNTGEWRLKIVPVALDMISRHPFVGYGLGQQRWNWPKETHGVLIPDPKVIDPLPIHNDYLLVSTEMGLGAFAIVVLLLSVSSIQLHQLAKQFESSGDRVMRDTARATQIALLGMALAMLMYPMLDSFRYFWLFLGATVSMKRIAAQTDVMLDSRE